MEALKLSFPQIIGSAAKKSPAPDQQDQALFASLLNSMSSNEAEFPSEEEILTEQVMESLESLLAFLQEIPVEEQTAEQQQLQYAILQLQELRPENTQVATLTSQMSESKPEVTDAPAKLIGLLENIQQKLQILSTMSLTEFEDSTMVKEATAQTNSITLNDLSRISKQLNELIATLEKEQQAAVAIQQEKPIGLSVEGAKAVKDLPRYINETLKSDKELPKVPADSKTAQEPTVQPTANVAVEAAKAADNQTRAEVKPSAAPFIRLSNLLEDLGGMLKSSMRLAETTEGMKMRVNIFPEHLGHLEILLTSTNGKLAAQIMASTPMAKEALELQLNQLRASLLQQGVAVEKIEVLQQNSQQPFSQQHSHTEQRFYQQQQRNGTTKQDKNGYFQSEEEKTAERQPSVGQLIKVDYTV